MMSALCEMNIIQRGESRRLAAVARPGHGEPLAELYEGTVASHPDRPSFAAARHDAIGRAAQPALDHLRAPLRDPLKRSVGQLPRNSCMQGPAA